MPLPLRVELDHGPVDHRERLCQVAIGPGGDAHFRPARRVQVAGGALLGARR